MTQNFTKTELKELDIALSWRIDSLYNESKEYEDSLINLQKKVNEYLKEV